jgi:hypothetical protein
MNKTFFINLTVNVMKIKHLPWILSFGAIVLFSGYTVMYPTGAPAAKTGSPGDGANCTECHGGTATTTAGQITSNIPVTGYVPGATYQITATNPLTGSGKLGFEVSPQNVAGTLLGTLVAGSGSQLVGSNKYVTHSNANSTTNTWTFSWIAPVAGTGPVTFYGAFARNKPGPVTKSTLTVQEAASAPGAAGPVTGPSAVCKSSTESYSGGAISGASSYVWTAPTGATILSGQGTTSVNVSFGTSANSGNISVYGTNVAGNGAASNKMITVNSVPAQTSPVTGTATPCQATTQSYSVTNLSGVTYTWTVPAGSAITSGQGSSSVTVSIGATNGNITVVPSNTCGNGSSTSFPLTVSLLPGTPSVPEGPAQINLQLTTTSDYSTSAGAETYQWQLSPVSAGVITGASSTAQVTWNTAFTGNAQITVKALNSCGESAWSAVKTTEVLNTTGIGEDVAGIRIITGESAGNLSLAMNTSANQATVMLLDLSGRVLVKTTIPGQGTYPIGQNLKSGIYILVVEAGNSILKKKILVI